MVALRMAALLEVSGISKSFPGVRALHEVGFSVDRGEVVALLGENGAGPSTLMNILAGVQPADREIAARWGARAGRGRYGYPWCTCWNMYM